MLTIGVLALQGDFAEHIKMLSYCGVQGIQVKRACDLNKVSGLIIPGGESTAIAKLVDNDPIFDTIINRASSGMPVYGTCMGLIFLAKDIDGSAQGRLGLMDIKVQRNAFGSQKFSREETVPIPVLGDKPFTLIFIRGPIIVTCLPSVQVLASVKEGIVMCQQKNFLATAFHPELTEDTRVHQYFIGMVEKYISTGKQACLPGNEATVPATSPVITTACPAV